MESPPTIPESDWHIDKGPEMLEILTPMLVITTVFVGLRIGVRLQRHAGIGHDDWLILVSLVLIFGVYVIAVCFVRLGGVGIPVLVNLATDPNRITHSLKTLYAGALIYATCISTTKLSILALYWRLFPTRSMRVGCMALSGVSIAWWIAVMLACIFQCQPVVKAWQPSLPGHCISSAEFFVGIIAPNIATDVAILFLPMYEVSKLQISRRQRVALYSVFLLGAGVIAVSGVRLHYHIIMAKQGNNADLTMGLWNPVLWTVLEPDMAVICACLPVLRPILTRFLNLQVFQSLAGYLTGKSGSSYSKKSAPARDASHTIGGTPLDSFRGRNGKARIGSAASWGDGGGDPEPARCIPEHGAVYQGGMWPNDYATGRHTVVSGRQGASEDEIPLGPIPVKSNVGMHETTRGY